MSTALKNYMKVDIFRQTQIDRYVFDANTAVGTYCEKYPLIEDAIDKLHEEIDALATGPWTYTGTYIDALFTNVFLFSNKEDIDLVRLAYG